jgi:hypothetical protein
VVLPDDGALEFRKRAHHLHHRAAGRRCRVNRFGERVKAGARSSVPNQPMSSKNGRVNLGRRLYASAAIRFPDVKGDASAA